MAAMKMYEVNGSNFWYHEGDQPKGATEVKQGKPANKGKGAANKDASKDKADKQPAAEQPAEDKAE